MGNIKNIDLLIVMNDLQQFASPSTTAVSTTVPSSEDFSKNQTQNLANLVGSIGSPQGLSEEELLEMVMSTSPVGASIRGGKAVKGTIQQMLDIAKMKNIRLGHPNKWKLSEKGVPSKKDLDYWKRTETVEDIDDFIKMDDAKDVLKNIMEKFGIENPDKIFRGFSKN